MVGSLSASLIGRLGQALSGYPPLQCRCRSRARASLRTRHQGPCMALSLSRNLPGPRIFFLRRFLDLISKSVSSSRPAHRWSMRAEAVKIGRRTNLAACFALARPYLDGFEHDGTLNAVAMTIRGEPAFGARFNRATTLYPVGPRTRTMMQSCASAAKLRSGGPILPFGVRAKGRLGIPPPRTVIGVPPQAYGQAETVVVRSAPFVHCAGRKTTPSGTMPSRMSRHRAISSLRAKATIMGFRVPRAFSVRDRNHFVKALFFWCRRNRHAN